MKRVRGLENKGVHRIPGHTPPAVETSRRFHEQAQRCAAGEHVYTWSGRTVDVPGGSPHLVMSCAYGALHEEGCLSPKRIGPRLTLENIAKHLWTEEELKEAASST
jgi:hypothetical protein